ncbi:Putative Mynd domain containing protein [[Torrubiella] hemipterigena]|uniref:MYND-type zinc finger protein samB n=1 Tax=[Torrubiella] hemipterigena TaxID=1531966 RepID=A0A0A1TSM6_9HYPO|nr:Putative Mynd domain containing protein [[Torrubiella] hemipterigena]
MREVNFSIPNVNKASVGITTALYDRRALDCTSTLPLIDSLNHLAYLTTSSARIRDILTVDGGIERLVCILKEGRSKDMMGIWKWNLAFQCVVNIGVRGTVDVRTRVVEADMVPVIATILDNYMQVIERCRVKAEALKKKLREQQEQSKVVDTQVGIHSAATLTHAATGDEGASLIRRPPPPSIDIAAAHAGPSVGNIFRPRENTTSFNTPATDHLAMRSGSYPTSRGTDSQHGSTPTSRQVAASANTLLETSDGVVRPVRDVERLASMTPFGRLDTSSRSNSPTTPLPPPQMQSLTARVTEAIETNARQRRPSIRHQDSTAEQLESNTDSLQSAESPDADMTGTADIRSPVGIQDISMDDGERILADETIELEVPTGSETQDPDTFNISHRSPMDGSIANNATTTPVPPIGLSPGPGPLATPQPTMTNPSLPRYLNDQLVIPGPHLLSVMPREEDVLMSLQLLAYVSKYGGLRSYFQQSHLVPRLTIGKELARLDKVEKEEDEPNEKVVVSKDGCDHCCHDEETHSGDCHEKDDETLADEEYLLENDFNLFPLVEKFTVKYSNPDMQRYFSTDMQYWAGVVMRNLCRKDEERGGIRQCAYYQCGKWEEYTRQFAKCRRCRRTKYCSKECQKSAWAYHRHWCVATSQ